MSEFPPDLPPSWQRELVDTLAADSTVRLAEFLKAERRGETIFPPPNEVFAAFRATPLKDVKVVILGQDPYPNPKQGHGLAFSVRPGVALPGSLRNIFKERASDLGIPPSRHGYLMPWAERGVLLLNAVLTVRHGKPNSHAKKGWEPLTDAALQAINRLPRRIVFLLWGAYAQQKAKLIDETRHAILRSAHPSPLSAHNGFFGSKPFSRANSALVESDQEPVDWSLPEFSATGK